MKRFVWLALVVLACGGCGKKVETQPQVKDASIQEDFQILDMNHDGSITKSEVEKNGTELLLVNFDKFDANKDGKLSLQEIAAYAMAQRAGDARRKKEAFDRIDLNHDGFISKEEGEKADRFFVTNFEDIDANKDGKLSLQELNDFAEMPSRRPGASPQAHVPQPAPQPKPVVSFAPLFMELDKDHNGTLSKKELQATPLLAGAFDRMDEDHDGAIMPEEFGNYLRAQAMPSQGAQPRALQTTQGK